MKKYLLIIAIIFAVVFVSGCIDGNSDGTNSTEIQTISKNGVILKYPSNWVISESTSNSSLISVAAANSIDSSKIGQVNVNVEKQPISESLSTFVNKTTASLEKDSSYEMISSGQTTMAGYDAIEVVYKSDSNGTMKMHKAVWIEKDGEAIVVLCSAPEDKFDSNLKIFDYIIANIQFR
ncbi:hypothetical protein [Methanobrevibacter sp. DSM 116169]|uniref:hypothetical protein n=1 Tax=Methanobrevibacter sp. DSM 116169 TaxID=3242727 RepID=UPI0038FBFB38